MVPSDPSPPRPRLTVAGYSVNLPATRLRRQALGYGFLVGGVFSFLPILGPWMFPVGFYILSVDSNPMRRRRRRMTVWLGRKWPKVLALTVHGSTRAPNGRGP